MTDYLGTDGHGFFKGTAGLRDVNGLISLKAILKYRHGSLTLVFYRPQIGTDWHRLRAKGSDWIDYGLLIIDYFRHG